MRKKSDVSRDKLYKIVKILERREKLNKVEKRSFNKIDIKELGQYYKKLLNLLKYYFEPVWLSDVVSGPSDDGYWDIRSSIIGFGKEFFLDSLEDDQLFIDMCIHHDYAENFGYIFN